MSQELEELEISSRVILIDMEEDGGDGDSHPHSFSFEVLTTYSNYDENDDDDDHGEGGRRKLKTIQWSTFSVSREKNGGPSRDDVSDMLRRLYVAPRAPLVNWIVNESREVAAASERLLGGTLRVVRMRLSLNVPMIPEELMGGFYDNDEGGVHVTIDNNGDMDFDDDELRELMGSDDDDEVEEELMELNEEEREPEEEIMEEEEEEPQEEIMEEEEEEPEEEIMEEEEEEPEEEITEEEEDPEEEIMELEEEVEEDPEEEIMEEEFEEFIYGDVGDVEIKFVPAEKSTVEGLEKVKVEGVKEQNCPICLEEILEATQLPCSHLFHGHCISDWLLKSGVCPLCRFLII